MKREGGAFAQGQQPGDRIDLAIGEQHPGNGRVPHLASLGMQGRGGRNLLADIGRSVDQEPVLTVRADGGRSLIGALGRVAARCPAIGTAAVPLRNAATCRGSKYYDFYHENGAAAGNTYLRLAQAYMLISMLTGISTMLGLFHAIAFLLIEHGECAAPHGANSCFRQQSMALITRAIWNEACVGNARTGLRARCREMAVLAADPVARWRGWLPPAPR